MRIFISQFTVNFITDNENIMFDTELCNRLQIFFRHNGACRIVRERQYQNLCLWCNRSFQFFCCQFKFIFFLKINNHRHTIRQHNARLIRNITWLRNNDLFTGIEHGAHGNINGFRTAHCYHNFVRRVIFNMAFAFQISTDFFLQFLQSGIGCIKCTAFFQRIDTFLTDMPRCIKIRFTHTKRNDIRVIHFYDKIKKLTDAGRFNVYDFIG